MSQNRLARRVLPALLAFLGVVAWSSRALAQTTMNPTRAEFNPSADHSRTLADGTPVVSSYRLDLFLQGAASPFQSTNLGKPAPDTDGIIRVDLTSVFVGWPVPGTVYTADVAAVGPGGAAASAMSNAFGFSAPCTFTATPTPQSVAGAGGTGTVSVGTTATCTWNATSNNGSWLTITAGASGTGNGTVTYSATPNTGTSSRSGTLTVAGNTITINQVSGCNATATPTSQAFTSAGGTNSVGVTVLTGCGWTATSNSSWITITGGASGSGNGTVNYSVAANTGAARSGSLTVAGQTISITQSAPCVYTLSTTTQSMAAGAGTASVGVTAGAGCNWAAASNASWITITSGASGSGNGTVNYSVTANTGTTARTGTLTVAGQTVTVTQAAPCVYTVTPLSQSFPSTGGNNSVTVTTGASCGSTNVSNVGWISIMSGGTLTTSGTVTYQVANYTGTTQRSGTMTIAGQTVTITQAAPCTYTFAPTTQAAAPEGGPYTVGITSACSWTATSGSSWITITAGGTGNGNGTVSYTTTPNITGSARSGTLSAGGQTFTVTQQTVAAPSAPQNVQIKP